MLASTFLASTARLLVRHRTIAEAVFRPVRGFVGMGRGDFLVGRYTQPRSLPPTSG